LRQRQSPDAQGGWRYIFELQGTQMLQYSYRPNFPPTRRTRTSRDQSWVDYLPMPERPRIEWPNGSRIAVWLCPNVLYYELNPPPDPWINAWSRMTPDVMMYGRQEFGARVGFWRMLDVLDKHGIPCTAVLNVAALKRFPDICAAIVARKWDLLGHGMTNTRFICGHDEDEERAHYQDMLALVRECTGMEMKGMGGPGPQAATESTPDLLAEAGFLYYADLFHDDQPFPIRVRSGRLISMPYSVEINDVPILSTAFEGDQFLTMVKRQFDRLYAEGAASGRVMCIAVHPAVIGQPQRTKYLDQALAYLRSFPDVWFATGREIAEHYLAHNFDAVRDSIRNFGRASS
jgi:peptidoglycan/xylan/chitin deacetylase (PgdA/CDA1 family)